MTAPESRSLLVRTLPVLVVLAALGVGTWYLVRPPSDAPAPTPPPARSPAPAPTPSEMPTTAGHALLGDRAEAVWDLGVADGVPTQPPANLAAVMTAIAESEVASAGGERVGVARTVIDYPLDGSVFPPEIVAPTILWHDTVEETDTWLVEVTFADGSPALRALVPGAPPSPGEIDERAIGDTNDPYELTPYQASAHTWTPPAPWWRALKERSVEGPARLEIRGVASGAPTAVVSAGHAAISTSRDPVGAPIFYRDVPLMPAVAEESGEIKPLAQDALPLIGWRLRDISLPESKLLLTDMPSCANCHSFSNDGHTFGMDVDGPQGDKGAYALTEVSPRVVIDLDDVITWNSFPDKPAGHRTIGFLSRVSPDGRYVASTVNESLYVSNFTDYRFLQVFFPTRGILAYYSQERDEMRALPGADDTDYVHCSPVWTPDGETIVFARAPAFDPYEAGKPLAREPNDPNEPRIQYDLYRIPFRDGKGGEPEPIEGASRNGMSNTFPKVSPDGKWLVFTKCRNGLLMRPDGRLWIVPAKGGEAREMRCNTSLMNSWHSWSPNSRWLVFSSKVNTPYTQMFLTHVDEDGNDSPPILVPNSTAANRAVNIPEFVNTEYRNFGDIAVPAVRHHRYYWAGLTRINQDRLEEGIELMRTALKFEPDWDRAHLGLGIALSMRGDEDEGIEHFQRALELNPDYAAAHHNLGYSFLQRGELEQAVHHLKRALALSPTMVKAEGNLAEALRRLGLHELAISHYALAIEQDPADLEAYRGLVKTWVAMDRPRKAVETLERLLARSPSDLYGLTNLAWHLATSRSDDLRDGTRAVALAERARDLTNGREVYVMDVLGAAYAEAGRFREALRAATEAVRIATAQSRSPGEQAAIAARASLYREQRPYRASRP